MNNGVQRKRFIWIAVLGGVLLLSLLFITLAAPSGPSAPTDPVLRVATETAVASGTATAVPTPQTLSSGSGFSIGGGQAVSLAWRLALVAIIIAVSIVGLRWWGKKTSGPRSTTGFIKVVDTLAISNGRTIHLVALGERVIAIGATTQQLTLLNELTDDEARDVLTQQPKGADQPLAAFASELFQSMRGTRRQPPRGPESLDSQYSAHE
ncbi:MAG: flagellar biosynthetic protein FliO [Tepidiformaceae bacterium]